jgi:hypothetical protein
MADRLTIYRVAALTDLDVFKSSNDPDDINSLLRIDFNYNPTAGDLKNAKKPNQWIVDYEVETTRSNADQQGAEKEMGDSEDLGVVERIHKFEIIITYIPDQPVILARLFTWGDDPDSSEDDNWPDGRFGVFDSTDVTNNLRPESKLQNPPSTTPRGLKLLRQRKKKIFGRNAYRIFMDFRESRGE